MTVAKIVFGGNNATEVVLSIVYSNFSLFCVFYLGILIPPNIKDYLQPYPIGEHRYKVIHQYLKPTRYSKPRGCPSQIKYHVSH